MRKFRLHVLGVPHTKTTQEYSACAYTQKVYKFCKMMTERGHYVIHYGCEGSDPICSENVVVVSKEVYDRVYGNFNFKQNFFRYSESDEVYKTFFANTIAEIQKRKQPNDIILPFFGGSVRAICDFFPDLITIEPGIGYGSGSWAKYRVFESYSIYSAYCGVDNINYCGNMNNYDVVIPNYFDLEDFEFNNDKEKRINDKDRYFLFVGRVYDGKGVNIAIQVCQTLGVKLKIAGQLGDEYKNYNWNENIEYVGYVTPKERCQLMKNAIASFLPSQYLEPFGGVQVENLLCGTPTITSDWGGFAENNIEGVTGYRCRTFDDYLQASLHCLNGDIDYNACRKQGEKFSLGNIAPKYEKFFNDVLNIYIGKGWYELSQDTIDKIHSLTI